MNLPQSNNNAKYELIKFISTSLIVPIIIGIITAYITFKMNKPKEYAIRETFNMNEFKTLNYFPLDVGNYWIYKRSMEYVNDDNEVKIVDDEVTKEVIEKYENDDMKLFVIKGDPLEMDLENKNIEPNNVIYGYIVLSNKIIVVPKQDIDLIVEKFKNKKSLYSGDTKNLNILFEFPLFDNQKYGDFDQLFRNDEKNISHVTELQPYKKKIGESIIDVGIYTINRLHNGGDESITFTPYIGITEYSYNHNGTTNKYYIKLNEYKIKE